MTLELILQLAAAVAALVSGGLWVRSATVKVRPVERRGPSGLLEPLHTDTDSNTDVHATLRSQSAWNAKAAGVAALAAALQALALLIQSWDKMF